MLIRYWSDLTDIVQLTGPNILICNDIA